MFMPPYHVLNIFHSLEERVFVVVVDLFVVPLPFYLVILTWFKGSMKQYTMYVLHGRGRTPGIEASWMLLRSFSPHELLVLGMTHEKTC